MMTTSDLVSLKLNRHIHIRLPADNLHFDRFTDEALDAFSKKEDWNQALITESNQAQPEDCGLDTALAIIMGHTSFSPFTSLSDFTERERAIL